MANHELGGVTCYVSAGGRGTRLEGAAYSHPLYGVAKALLEVGNPPMQLINHQLNRAFIKGYGSVIVGLGDQAEYIAGSYRGRFFMHPGPGQRLGTGGDLLAEVRKYRKDIGDTVVVHNVDTIVSLEDDRLVARHRQSGADATIALTTRRGVPNQDAFFVGAEDAVLYTDEAREASPDGWHDACCRTSWRGSSTGVVALKAAFLDEFDWQPGDGEYSLYRDILPRALGGSGLAAYNNGNRFFLDVGTPQTLSLARGPANVVQPHLQYGDYDRELVEPART